MKVAWTRLSEELEYDFDTFTHAVTVDGQPIFYYFVEEFIGTGFYARMNPDLKDQVNTLIIARCDGHYQYLKDIKANAAKVQMHLDGQPMGGLLSFIASEERWPGDYM